MEKTPKTCESCSKKSSCTVQDTKPGESPEHIGYRFLIDGVLSIKNKILVMSGKGGVGKSSTAVNLALALVQEGKAVGMLDVDIHGPSVPKMLGAESVRPKGTEEYMLPIDCHGLKVMSIGFLLPKQTDAIIWRGPMKTKVIQQFVRDVEWGDLDYLVVDCPPGTGDEPLSILQLLGKNIRAVIVTTPQEVPDRRQKVNYFCRQLTCGAGVIENMSGFVCPIVARWRISSKAAAANGWRRKWKFHFWAVSPSIRPWSRRETAVSPMSSPTGKARLPPPFSASRGG